MHACGWVVVCVRFSVWTGSVTCMSQLQGVVQRYLQTWSGGEQRKGSETRDETRQGISGCVPPALLPFGSCVQWLCPPLPSLNGSHL